MKVYKNKSRNRNYLITFDMNTKTMSELFGETKYRKAYKIMEDYFKSFSFTHDQHSVYITSTPMLKEDLDSMVASFCDEYPYIAFCIRKIVYSNVPKQHDMTNFTSERSSERVAQINETFSKEITVKDMFTPVSQWEKDPIDDL